jgi:hypothetical protein
VHTKDHLVLILRFFDTSSCYALSFIIFVFPSGCYAPLIARHDYKASSRRTRSVDGSHCKWHAFQSAQKKIWYIDATGGWYVQKFRRCTVSDWKPNRAASRFAFRMCSGRTLAGAPAAVTCFSRLFSVLLRKCWDRTWCDSKSRWTASHVK